MVEVLCIFFACLTLVCGGGWWYSYQKYALLQHQRAQDSTLHDQEKTFWQQKLDQVQHTTTQMNQWFESLGQKMLHSNHQQFLSLAKETLETFHEKNQRHMQQHHHQVTQLHQPLQTLLEGLDKKVAALEKGRIAAEEGLRHHLSDLLKAQHTWQKEAESLVTTLRVPQQRGQWGEIQLRRVIELAGMLPYCDFSEQPTLDEGRLRPDVVVTLPGKRWIMIDAKAPWSVQVQGADTALLSPKEQAKRVKGHIKTLADKAYQHKTPQGSPDMVIMFLPLESFLGVALQGDETLMDFAAQNRVMMATPTSLLALLHGLAYGWRQSILTQNTQDIAHWAEKLRQRLQTLSQYIQDVGKTLGTLTGHYNRVVGSMQQRVLPAVRKLEDLGVTSGSEFKTLQECSVQDIRS